MSTPRIHFNSKTAVNYRDYEDALDFFTSYNIRPDEWQKNILKDWLARRDDKQWAHGNCGLSVPRQNGKSLLLELRIIFGMVFLKEKILFSSHEVKSAQQIFNRLIGMFEDTNHPELMALVKKNGIRRTNGQEGIMLTNGGSVNFIARTKGGGRGFTVDTLILDECQSLNAESFAALRPAISAAPQGNPQVILAGTPPSDKDDAEIFGNYRSTAIEGKSETLSWIEFSAESGDDPDDKELWKQANPALSSGRLSIEDMQNERDTFPEDNFMRERLGVWGSANGTTIVDMDVWQKYYDQHSSVGTGAVLALDISPNGSTASIAVASNNGTDDEPKVHVEVIESRAGSAWVKNRVIELCKTHNIRTVILDVAGPAGTVLDDLRRNKIKVILPTVREITIGCGMFVNAVNDGTIIHLSQPSLDIAIRGARKRKLQDAFAWARSTSSADITPLIAVTLAHWGARNSKVKKTKERDPNKTSSRRARILR